MKKKKKPDKVTLNQHKTVILLYQLYRREARKKGNICFDGGRGRAQRGLRENGWGFVITQCDTTSDTFEIGPTDVEHQHKKHNFYIYVFTFCEMNKFISTESTLPGSVHLAQIFNLSETKTGRTLSLQHVIFKMVCLYVST